MSAGRSERGSGRDGEHFAQLVGRLTARDRWLLAMLAEHTVLTSSQLLRLGWAPSPRRTQRRLLTLLRAGLLDRFRPLLARGSGTAPWHLVLGTHGAAVLAAETGHTVTQIGYRGRVRALAVAHRMTLAHDIAVHDLIADLAATHPEPRIILHQWWSAARCRRCFGHHVRPDAYLCLTTAPSGGWWEMFLEYDTGTEALHRLAGKLSGYHDLAAASGIVTPVACWITRPGREPTARRALHDALRALPHPELVPVLTATPLLRNPANPPTDTTRPAGPTAATGPTVSTGPTAVTGPTAAGRVWLPVTTGARTPARVGLTDLATSPPLTAPAPAPHSPPGAAISGAPPPGDEVSRDTSVLAPPCPVPPSPGGSR